jgi:hypothetical protein
MDGMAHFTVEDAIKTFAKIIGAIYVLEVEREEEIWSGVIDGMWMEVQENESMTCLEELEAFMDSKKVKMSFSGAHTRPLWDGLVSFLLVR